VIENSQNKPEDIFILHATFVATPWDLQINNQRLWMNKMGPIPGVVDK
jgi:hypothetical protein